MYAVLWLPLGHWGSVWLQTPLWVNTEVGVIKLYLRRQGLIWNIISSGLVSEPSLFFNNCAWLSGIISPRRFITSLYRRSVSIFTTKYQREIHLPSGLTFRFRTRSILLATSMKGRSDPRSCLKWCMVSSTDSNEATSSTEYTRTKASKKPPPTLS